MKFLFKFIIFSCFFTIFLESCQNNKNKLREKERELALREQRIREEEQLLNQKKYSKPTKYVYIVVQIREPKLISAVYLPATDSWGVGKKIPAKITFEKKQYVGQINKIEEYDEDKKYEFMDKMEIEFGRTIIANIESRLSHEIFLEDNAVVEIERLEKQAKAKIVGRELKIFDSYSEASISRQKMIR